MTTRASLYEINHIALQVLIKEIGAVNTLRFIRQFSSGYGNYTMDRQELFKDATLSDLVADIKALRKSK